MDVDGRMETKSRLRSSHHMRLTRGAIVDLSKLPAGTRLGPYEIAEPIGSGGMGHVYRGRDTRLGRDVAIKVLADALATDGDAMQRFHQEAQAASALNHPNIVTVFDVGVSDEAPFIVTELLHGTTLRHALATRHLTPHESLNLLAQAADGIAAAHAKGILHRDIKPENLFVTDSGTVKILDFGVSKLTRDFPAGDGADLCDTRPGMFFGTPGYVSPEQIQHQPTDHRTDIFSLGVVLYEALTGRAPFRGDSPGQTLSATLFDEPAQVSQLRPGLTAAIDEVVRACMDKNSERRFDSAADLAIALRAIEPVVERAGTRTGHRWRRRAAFVMLAALIVLASIGALAVVAGGTAQPAYRRVTFVRGTITSGRFKQGTNEIVYDATVNGQPRQLFATIPGSAEARALDLRGAELLAISPAGDLAVILDRRLVRGFVGTGTLAVFREGTAPRRLLNDVHAADWRPDGGALAVVRDVGGRTRLEYPVNTAVFETSGWISDPRVSRDGMRLAFVDHPINADDFGRVIFMDRDRSLRKVSGDWVSVLGLAWSPDGNEIWFTAQDGDGVRSLRGVDLRGRQRVIAQVPARLRLLDASIDGRVLLARDDVRLEAYGLGRGEADERNLSWLDWSLSRDISPDGSRLLLTEFGEAAAEHPSIYMRDMNGSAAARLGTGSGLALSPDGQRVLALWNRQLSLVPVGAGDSMPLPKRTITSYDPWAAFFPDGRRVVFTGTEAGHAARVYMQDVPAGTPVAITPEGFRVASPGSVSPSGNWIVAADRHERLFVCDASGGAPRPLPGAQPGDALARWDRDGRGVFLFDSANIPARVFRVGLNGHRELVRTLAPDDLAGAIAIHRLVMTSDGAAYAYTLERQLSDLYVGAELSGPTLLERLPIVRRIVTRFRND